MRVLHVDSARGWRGGQNQVLLTARGMAARGHEVVLACQAGGALEAKARAADLALEALAFRGDLTVAAAFALVRLMRRFRPDIVQLHDPHAVSAGLVAARLTGRARVVATRRADFALRGALSRRKYRACDRVITVSRAILAVLEKEGLPRARLRLVYEGVPDRAPEPGGRETLLSIGVPLDCPLVGNVAALTDHKDHATLIEAAARVRARAPEARFVVLGEGELRPRIQALIAQLRLGDRVFLAGFRTDVDRLLAAFTVFCLSSHMEGLGTSLLDAMAFARPIVATAAGGIPEAVEDGVSGRLVPPRDPEALADALVQVLIDVPLQEALGAAGRRRFEERFTADRMVDATLAVYEELM